VGESVAGMAVDAGGNILIAGFANSTDLSGQGLPISGLNAVDNFGLSPES
jgi:hypothetical protein